MWCQNCANVIPDSNKFCGMCGTPVASSAGSELPAQRHTARLAAPPDERRIAPLGPGELIGITYHYEVIRVVSTTPNGGNLYVAQALDVCACAVCGSAVIAQLFCSGCGSQISDPQPATCYIVETAETDPGFFVMQRIKRAQERSFHPGIVPLYDVFTANQRAYAVQPAPKHTVALKTQPWQRVVQWGMELASALDWLHQSGVVLSEIAPGMLAVNERGVYIALLGRSAMLTSTTQEQAIAASVSQLARTLEEIGADTPPSPLEEVFKRAKQEDFTSAEVFATALQAVEPGVRRAAQIIVQSAAICDQGRVRANNEDGVGMIEGLSHRETERRHWGLYVVSDGMGGHAGGEIASAMSVATFLQTMLANIVIAGAADHTPQDWYGYAEAAAQAVNRAVYDARTQARSDMGATLVAAALHGDCLTILHLGDSRAYAWDGSQLTQLTEDHSLIAQLVAIGEVTPAEARTHPQRSVLIQSVGEKPMVKPGVSQHSLRPGQRILLCSDGLHGMVEDSHIAAILARQLTPLATCQALVDAANACGGEDNISALVIDYTTLGLTEAPKMPVRYTEHA